MSQGLDDVEFQVIRARDLSPGDIVIVKAPIGSKAHSIGSCKILTNLFSPHNVKFVICDTEVTFEIIKVIK